MPPVLETARLRLRVPRVSDAPAVFRYASDPEVTRYLSWPTHQSLEDTHVFLSRCEEDWQRARAFPYLIEWRDGGELVGSTGLMPDAPFRASTGYVIAREAWGQGLATEALGAVLEAAFRRPALWRVEALCHAAHRASARVMEKCGMQPEGVLRRAVLFPNLSPEPQDVLVSARVR